MNKTKILILAIALSLVALGFYLFFINKKAPLTSPVAQLTQQTVKEVMPSETITEYSDPSGFIFSYPDNLSINKKDVEDESVYADLQLSSKDVSGSLSLTIKDSKFLTLDKWAQSVTKSEKDIKEAKLGTLAARQIKLEDRVVLGALDQGILFTVEMPLIEEKFWSEVYEKVLASFSFVAPPSSSDGSVFTEDVTFEGEEVVE